jgi:hypothetical protein
METNMPNKISIAVFLGDDPYGVVDIAVEAGATTALADAVMEAISNMLQSVGATFVSDEMVSLEPVL